MKTSYIACLWTIRPSSSSSIVVNSLAPSTGYTIRATLRIINASGRWCVPCSKSGCRFLLHHSLIKIPLFLRSHWPRRRRRLRRNINIV
jgi:hypothetical protein